MTDIDREFDRNNTKMLDQETNYKIKRKMKVWSKETLLWFEVTNEETHMANKSEIAKKRTLEMKNEYLSFTATQKKK